VATPAFLTAEGFLKVNRNAAELRRFLDAYERGWSGVVGSLSALLEHLFPSDKLNWTKVPASEGWDFAFREQAWRVVAGLTTALDPMLIALLRPGCAPNSTVVGDVLLSFVNDILEAAAEMPPEKLAFTASDVVREIRNVLLLCPLLRAGATDKEFITALKDVHGLSSPGEAADAATKLAGMLLDTIATGTFTPMSWEDVKVLSNSHSEQGGTRVATGFAQDPFSVVVDATRRLADESGAEQTILRLFASAATAGGGSFPDLLYARLVPAPPPNDTDHVEFRRSVLKAWNAYGVRLEGSFNGEEAIRRSASADFLAVLQREAALTTAEPGPADLVSLLEAADYFKARIASQNVNVFGVIASALPQTMPGLLGNPTPDLKLSRSYTEMLWGLKRFTSADAIFEADGAPAPLPIQVSASLGVSDLDDFSSDFNGICVALRRIDRPNDLTLDPWAQANLAELAWDHDAHSGGTLGLRQWLPAVQDSRAPAFIDYDGFPFASRTIARVSEAATKSDMRKPFYAADVAEEQEFKANGWVPLPRLVYGRTFEAFSFATTNSGSLPLDLQEVGLPWMPKKRTLPGTAPTVRAAYSRRTNIGSLAILEGNGPKRLGIGIADVSPLSNDYPRHAVFSKRGALGSLDLMREPDGSGVLAVPSGPGVLEVHLSDLQWSGKPETLRVIFFDRAALAGSGKPISLRFDNIAATLPHASQRITLRLSEAEVFSATLSDGRTEKETRLGARNSLWWIRIQLESDAGAGLSFVDPIAHAGSRGSAPLLLMAPSGSSWKPDFTRQVGAWISSPRVGFFDFERWYGNPELVQRTFGAAAASGRRLLDWLLLAYVRRKELLQLGEKENLSSALDRLPDPAVERLRVELVCLDTLNEQPPVPADFIEIDLKERIFAWGAARTTDIATAGVVELRAMFAELARALSFRVEIESIDPDLSLSEPSAGVYRVNVPPGVVAELRVSSLVANALFEDSNGHPPVIHPGVAQTAVRDGAWQVFPGSSLKIESMLEGPSQQEAIGLASRVISCSPQPKVREYKVISTGCIADVGDRRRWRLVSHASVSTQRWRPGGLPIYNRIDPRVYVPETSKGVPVPGAALNLRDPGRDSADPLRLFEEEIFLAREAEEAETVWKAIDPQVPMQTADQSYTVLQSIPWEAPSATYMRHRFQLRSRYAGALRTVEHGTFPAWPESAKGVDAWTRRVAMLADRSRALVTRPQLRALMPLTTSPHMGGTPPIIAFLQEPPFSEGGLADCVAADLKLGFGFGFSADPGQVGILDARKEFGPDPRLDYRRISDEYAVGIALAAEGPIGLTFDIPRASAATFSNSIISMTPSRADGAVLARKYEEHFAGVSLKRYLSPGWLSDQLVTRDPVTAAGCYWFELDARSAANQQVMLTYDGKELLRAMGGFLEVRTALIDKSGEDAKVEWVAIAPCIANGQYSVLHSPVAPNRFSASVFLAPESSSPSHGITNQPLLIASFEWCPLEESTAMTVHAPGGTAQHSIASSPTFLAWSRTTRDFRTVLIEPLKVKDNEVLEEVAAGALVGRVVNGKLRFEAKREMRQFAVTLRPSTLPQFVLDVHRHLAIIGTRPAAGVGKPVQVFAGSAMVQRRSESFVLPSGFSEASHLHLAEYEVPSKPLISGFTRSDDGRWIRVATVPEPFAINYVDFKATAATWDRELLVFIRFASDARKEKYPRLSLRFELPDRATLGERGEEIVSSPAGASDLEIELPRGTAAFGAELLFLPDSSHSNKIVLRLVLADGRRVPMGEKSIERPKDSGFLLSLAADAEFRADFSMLHFPAGHLTREADAWPFSFELLFSKSTDLPPGEAIRPKELAAREETQARIVSISPPIPIERES